MDHVPKKVAFILPCKLDSATSLPSIRKEAVILENKHGRHEKSRGTWVTFKRYTGKSWSSWDPNCQRGSAYGINLEMEPSTVVLGCRSPASLTLLLQLCRRPSQTALRLLSHKSHGVTSHLHHCDFAGREWDFRTCPSLGVSPLLPRTFFASLYSVYTFQPWSFGSADQSWDFSRVTLFCSAKWALLSTWSITHIEDCE